MHGRLTTHRGHWAIAAMGAALALVVTTAALGSSAAVVPLPGGRFPLSAHLHASPWLVTALLAAAVGASVGATILAWQALAAGWAPDPRRLLVGGLLALAGLAVVPPVGGADVLSYAAYGRISARGLDAYAVHPDQVADPFTQAVEDPWRGTPSVYGPVATAEQSALVRLSRGNLRRAVGLLDLVNALAFGLASLLVFALAGPDAGRRRRAVLAFGLNPVLVLVVVAEGHVDALVVLAVVAALWALRRSLLAGGVLVGLSVLVKLTAGLPLAGWAGLMALRRRWGDLVAVAAGAGVVVLAGYAAVGLHALDQARAASRFVSVGTPWRPLRSAVQAVAGHGAASLVVTVGSLLVAAALAARLARTLPGTETGDPSTEYARAGLVVALAWALASPYVLAWYDAVPWALLALLPASRFHRLLLAHTGLLALAYLPGRVVPLPRLLSDLTTGVRSGVTPAALTVVLAAAFLVQRRPDGQAQRSHS